MKNISFRERILRTAQSFMSADGDRFKKEVEGDGGLIKDLFKFLESDNSLRLLLKRGDTDNLSEHWTQGEEQGEAKFSKLLRDDDLERLNVSNLIDAMRNLGK